MSGVEDMAGSTIYIYLVADYDHWSFDYLSEFLFVFLFQEKEIKTIRRIIGI